MKKWLLIWILLYSCNGTDSSSEGTIDLAILDDLVRINSIPKVIPVSNDLQINNAGGHLQGIQTLDHDRKKYAILSGSSSTYSYYAVVDMGSRKQVVAIEKILDRPFKHAGGFQIADKYMAIGIEDNEARNHSYVYVYDLSSLPVRPTQPVAIIERKGPRERATAGCVAITFIDDQCLIIVGDWDTRHLDFYLSDSDVSNAPEFKLMQSLTMLSVNRNDWSDDEWLPYQNINIHNKEGQLYLLGLTSNSQRVNIVDIYRLEAKDFKNFNLKKIGRKLLKNLGGDFISAGGIEIQDGDIKGILSSDRNLEQTWNIYYYRQ